MSNGNSGPGSADARRIADAVDRPAPADAAAVPDLLGDEVDRLTEEFAHQLATGGQPDAVRQGLAQYLARENDVPILASLLAAAVEKLADR